MPSYTDGRVSAGYRIAVCDGKARNVSELWKRLRGDAVVKQSTADVLGRIDRLETEVTARQAMVSPLEAAEARRFRDASPQLAGGAAGFAASQLDPGMTGLEWGGGAATPYWCDKVAVLHTVESDPGWALVVLDAMRRSPELMDRWRLHVVGAEHEPFHLAERVDAVFFDAVSHPDGGAQVAAAVARHQPKVVLVHHVGSPADAVTALVGQLDAGDYHRQDFHPGSGVDAESRAALTSVWVRTRRESDAGDGNHRRRVVLHLGASKTGTTSLQRFFRRHGDELALQGWVCQIRSSGPLTEALKLVRTASKGDEGARAEAARALAADLGSVRESAAVFVSDESLIGAPSPRLDGPLYQNAPRRVDILAEALAGTDVSVVFAVRNQADFLESYYVQSVQAGGSKTFDAFLDRVDASQLTWTPVLELLRDRLDRSLTVVPYEHLAARGPTGVIDAMTSRLGVELRVDKPPVHNVSFSERELLVALVLAPLLEVEEREAVRRNLQKSQGTLRTGRPRLLTEDGRRALMGAVRADNVRLFDEFIVDGHDFRSRYVLDGPLPEWGSGDVTLVDPMWAGMGRALDVWRSTLTAEEVSLVAGDEGA